MRVLKSVTVRFMDEEVTCSALFDSGSGVTVVRRNFFEEAFGAAWSKLSKPLKLFWINGDSIMVDKYVQVVLVIDGFELPETVFIVDDFVKEVKVQGKIIKLPDLVVGSGTMDKYGITLDPKEGVKLAGATLLL